MNPNEVFATIKALDEGRIRVAEKNAVGEWKTNLHAKTAIVEYFKLQKVEPIQAGDLIFWDKIPQKKLDPSQMVRLVPPGIIRYGAYVAPKTVIMPAFVNIGAYVDEGTLVDTWATIGSCAQIGKNVHISGGVGIGGVLEPIQANPVIIEDYAFLGSRCIVVEGAIIEEGAVLAAGVTITGSSKIIDVTQSQPLFYEGRVPAYSVVIPGSYVKNFSAGSFSVSCALIIGKRSMTTDKKLSLNEALRHFQIAN
ncbi:MAG: 2,3,4,5-tetrahydropyridine-2,6-dicarboxylate N-succinyltransferase [Bdellovibrionaceae bacterium]|nr:2,3,4,5-tetrahydropyridine-2,6-dicarboxylate N-succinyltransferase [Pseudobdellovibrionaceae bacterium]MDW8191233.1 2,3,4,5-tetrahydropyridine-2,6-dicarboxylate N-succinyltransferase [Pseudobdellovibrionaceae bacterium]